VKVAVDPFGLCHICLIEWNQWRPIFGETIRCKLLV